MELGPYFFVIPSTSVYSNTLLLQIGMVLSLALDGRKQRYCNKLSTKEVGKKSR